MSEVIGDRFKPVPTGLKHVKLKNLFPISILYSGVVRLRNLFYQTGLFKVRKLGCRVISVGNITVGGTGKTPMVIMLANLLNEKGYRPAILSRGYAGKGKSRVNIVSDGKNLLMSPKNAGDEPALIAKSVRNVPVITGKNRYLTGKYAIEHFRADVLILDDAFQHRSVFRDIDIVLLDNQKPFGNGFTIPRGELREPASALERADIIVKTGNGRQETGDRGQWTGTQMFEAYRKPVKQEMFIRSIICVERKSSPLRV
ncbi:MAG: tetraacyldisaccharide 4'-kinase [Deltaproteobacteria bacterium]|nr:tetraacyldisaccharide 4'-kinase [Deltaproteobacteria bacterium]